MEQDVQRNIGKTLVVYLGSAWVFIEALNFLIDKYNWHSEVLDVLILLVIFGLPAVIIYAWFYQNFTRKAIILQLINGLLAISVITYKYINPDSFKTEELRLLRFKDDQKKLARAIRSIAILPFDNYTGDDNQIHILLGLHDALISELGQLGAIRVISKTSSMAYAGSQKTIKEIASELEVDGIIEASVFRLDESIEIQLKLINAFPTEQQLWSKTYNSDISSTLNLYSEVVKNIAKEIHLTLSPEEEKRLTEPRSVHPEAYRAYLKSQYLYDSFNPADFSVALQYLDSALVFDPNYLNAHLGIAQIWIGRAQMGLVPYVEAYPIIKAAEQKAIELNIESAELHIILATIRAYEEWNWEQGLVELKRALDLNPNSSDARTNYSYLLAMLDNHDEAKIQIDLALELDPFRKSVV